MIVEFTSFVTVQLDKLGYYQHQRISSKLELISFSGYAIFVYLLITKITYVYNSFAGITILPPIVPQVMLGYIFGSLALKGIGVVVFRKIIESIQYKKIGLVLLILSREMLYLPDAIGLYYSFVYSNNSSLRQGMILLAIINYCFCLMYKGLDYILTCNYVYTCQSWHKCISHSRQFFVKEFLIVIIMFEVFMNGLSYFVATLIALLLFIVTQLNHQLEDLPNVFEEAALMKLYKLCIVTSMWITLCLSYAFAIMYENIVLLFIVLNLFLTLGARNYLISKREVFWERKIIDIDSPRQTMIKLLHYSELVLTRKDNMKLTADFKKHQRDCVEVDCPCHNVNNLDNSDITNKIYRQLLFKQTEKNCVRFDSFLEPHMLMVGALGMMESHPRFISRKKQIETRFVEELEFTDLNILSYLKLLAIDKIEAANSKDNAFAIEKIKEYETDFLLLKEKINASIAGKSRVWSLLLKNNVEPKQLEDLLIKDQQCKDQILEIYERLIKISSTSGLFAIMQHYFRMVLQDTQLERQIINRTRMLLNDKLDTIFVKGRAIALIENPNSCLVRISAQIKTLGHIIWHSKNLPNIFKYKQQKNIIGQDVAVLMPSIYAEQHGKFLQRWFNNPVSNITNRFTQVYMKTETRQFTNANLYVKVVPLQDSFQVMGMIIKSPQQQYLVVNEKLQLLNRPKILINLLNSKEIQIESRINFGLICQDLLCNDKEFTEDQDYELILQLPYNYPEIYQEYQTHLKLIEGLDNQKEQSLRKYYNSLIEMMPHKVTISLKVEITRKNIGDHSYIFMKYVEEQPQGSCTKSIQQSTIKHDTDDDSNIIEQQQQQLVSISSCIVESNSVKMKTEILKGELKNKQLSNFLLLFWILVILIFTCLTIQIYFTKLYTNVFIELIQTDSNLSNTMSRLEFLYDYTLVLKSNYQYSSLTSYQIDFYLEGWKYLTKQLLDQAQKDNNNAVINNNSIGYLDVYEYLHQTNPIVIQDHITRQNNNIFFKQWIVTILDLNQNFQSIIYSQQEQNPSTQAILAYLKTNFPVMKSINHKLIVQYQNLGTQTIYQIKTFYSILVPTMNVSGLIISVCLTYYLYKIEAQKRQLLEIFTRISMKNMTKYNRYYEKKCKIQPVDVAQLPSSTHLYMSLKPNLIKPKIRSGFMLFVILALCQVLAMVTLFQYITPVLLNLTDLNQLMDSQGYLIQTMISINQIISEGTAPTSTVLQQINTTLYQNQISFVKYSNSVLQSFQYSEAKNNLLQTYTSNICNNETLNSWQYAYCMNFTTPIMENGILSAVSNLQRFLYSTLVKLGNFTSLTIKSIVSDPNFIEVDMSLLFLTEVFGQIQQSVINYVKVATNQYMFTVAILATVHALILVSGVLYSVRFMRQQNKEYCRIMRFLQFIPEEQYKDNKLLEIMLNRIKNRSYSNRFQ